MKNKLIAILLMSALVDVVASASSEARAADGDNYSVATGFDYSTGKYGSATATDILSIPVVGIYETGLWIFSLTVPYVWITGDGSVVPGMGGAVPGTGGAVSGGMGSKGAAGMTQSGLGDVIAEAANNIYSGSENDLEVYLTGKVKFATADTGLGTGESDYAAEVDVYKGMDGFSTVISLGYLVIGNPPGGDLNNAAYGMLGGYYNFTDQTSGGVEMSLSQNLSATGAKQRELTARISHRFDESLRISGYVLKGFSDGSPDSGFGMLVSSDF
jgi:hypothetical protein